MGKSSNFMGDASRKVVEQESIKLTERNTTNFNELQANMAASMCGDMAHETVVDTCTTAAHKP